MERTTVNLASCLIGRCNLSNLIDLEEVKNVILDYTKFNHERADVFYKSKNTFTAATDILSELKLFNLENIITTEVNAFAREANGANSKLSPANSWVVVYEKGEMILPHSHPNSIFSVAFYPEVEDDTFVAINPILASYSSPLHVDTYDTKIKSGDMIIFPSYLNHYTRPLQCERKIVLSINFISS